MEKSEPACDIRILRDVKIPMRDGVKLSCNIFLPHTEGRFPVILQRMPYGASGVDPGVFYARRGHAYLMQDCRGRFDSEGEFFPFREDGPDGHDTLDWICAQEWSNSRVGMFGPSYLGMVQWYLAVEQHPALQAIVPNVCTNDFWRRGWYCGGTQSLALTGLWSCLEVSSRTSDLGIIPAYDLDRFFRHLPLATLDDYAGRSDEYWQEIVTNGCNGAFWDELCLLLRK